MPNNTQPKPAAPEVNPGKIGNNTEVDLDKGNTQTYPGPGTNAPEQP